MITYRDRAWCSHKCRNKNCYRNYTDEEHERNEITVNLPISVMDMKTDKCGYMEPDSED